MSAPSTDVRARVKAVIEEEFDTEGFVVEDDRLGRSAGMEISEGARLACFPDREYPRPGRLIELRVPVILQFYLAYTAEPDETIAVDPSTIEGYADRARRAFDSPNSTAPGDVWFLNFLDVTYPPDPTGNISRFEARIEGVCSNPAALP